MATCELVFDLGSPYSYLAVTQLPGLLARTGAELRLTPVALGGIFKAMGSGQLPPAPRVAWMRRDLELWAAKYGVPVSFPAIFPTRTINAQRALVAAGQGEPGLRATRALFDAYWAQGKDLADGAVVKAALDGAGLDGAALIARSEEPAIKDALRANTDAALARGVFGVPTFFVGDALYWGNDRLEFVEAALRAP